MVYNGGVRRPEAATTRTRMNDVNQALNTMLKERFVEMGEIVQTMLNQIGGIGPICAMTGAQIIYDTTSATLYFKRQVGKQRISHLKLVYNEGTDLYDLVGYRYNKRTFQCPEVWSLSGVYADSLKRVCEDITGLYFTL